jgi:hypothetical protein
LDPYTDSDPNCDYYYPISPTQDCSDTNATPPHSNTKSGETYGPGSRCFSQCNLRDNGPALSETTRCYTASCSNDGLTISVVIGDQTGYCTTPNQQITFSGYIGYVTCPANFANFCGAKTTANYCYLRGILNNG